MTALSGPLARYGRAGAIALELWAANAGMELRVADAHPSVGDALARLLHRRPMEVLFGPYGAGAAVAAAGASSSVLWNHGGATERLSRPDFAHVVNVPAPAVTYLATVIDTLGPERLDGARAVLIHSVSGFGNEVAQGALVAAARAGLEVRSVPFARGQGAVAARRADEEPAEVLLVAGAFEDEVAVAERLLARDWAAAAFVAAGVDEVLAPVAARLDGVYGPCQWLAEVAPEPEDGPDASWFTAAYARAAGAAPPYPAAAAFAAGTLWERCVRDARGTDPHAVQAAASRLATSTLFGAFGLDPVTGLQVGHRVGVVQWRHGRRVVVSPPT